MRQTKKDQLLEKSVELMEQMGDMGKKLMTPGVPFTPPEPAKFDISVASTFSKEVINLLDRFDGMGVIDVLRILEAAERVVSLQQNGTPFYVPSTMKR